MSLKNSLILIWVYVLYVVGIWLFLSGFLLKRIEIHRNSTRALNLASDIVCHDFSSLHAISFRSSHYFFSDLGDTVNAEIPIINKIKKFHKAIVIVIDALRYDFAVFKNETSKENYFYTNKLTVFTEFVANFSRNSLLVRFMADAPTTTLQRLKGLTTGSLPTFIDVSLNFASNKIYEDNLIHQMQNKKIVFMGDETWESLFPEQFFRSYSYPSFNVKDLDTVDNGILDHIFTEMVKDDWDVIIAHFLGVDHCGHRYGPRHPAMERKLLQMDSTLRKVISLLKEDTVLFVLGDHGMTETGDHGGDSTDEISTIMFVYSPSYIIPRVQVQDVIKTASQIDLVPTFSLLLGLPIPFSNLGTILPEFFFLEPPEGEEFCFHEELDILIGSSLALAENAIQVHHYFRSYMKSSGEFPQSVLDGAEAILHRISPMWTGVTENINQSKEYLTALQEGYQEYLLYIKHHCASRWAVFNFKMMLLGIIFLLAALLLNLWEASEILNVHKRKFLYFIVVSSISVTGFMFHTKHIYILLCLCVCIFLIMYWKYLCNFVSFNFLSHGFEYNIGFEFNVVFITSLSLFLSCFSNSFVIHEDSIILFFLQTTIFCAYFPYVLMTISSSALIVNEKNKKRFLNKKISRKRIFPLLILLGFLICVRFSFIFHKCREEQLCDTSRFLTALESLSVDSSNEQGMRLIVSSLSVILPVTSTVLLINNIFSYNYTILTFCSNYAIPFASICICLHWWLLVAPAEAVEKILKGNQVILAHCVTSTSLLVIFCIWSSPMISDKPWVITAEKVYSGSLGLLCITILQTLYLVAGDGVAPALSLMLLSTILFLRLEWLVIKASTQKSKLRFWLNSLIWYLLSWNWFYGTGHQQTFPAIQWHPAFLLQRNVSNYLLSGVLVLLNTFSSQVFCGIALPFFVIWLHSSMNNNKMFLKTIHSYLLFHGIKLFGASLSCWLLRRHLMVWKIFAPKLAYDAASTLVTILSITFGYLFYLRITSVYHLLIKKNINKLWPCKELTR